VLLVLATVLVVLEDLVVEQAAAVATQDLVVLLLNLEHLVFLVVMDMAILVVLIPIRHVIQDLVAAVPLVLVLLAVMVVKHLEATDVLAPTLDPL
jgi:hypothetical protein